MRKKTLKIVKKRGIHRWMYYHAHWLFKWLSSYAYEFNVQIEETVTEMEKVQNKIQEQSEINELIKTKKYLSQERT